jgi:hypothetical protein
MGYSHAWRLKQVPSTEQWAMFLIDVRTLFALPEMKALKLIGTPFKAKPVLKDTEIVMNAKIGFGYEPLRIERHSDRSHCCKTNWMPYDPVVVAVLVLLFHRLESEGVAVFLGDDTARCKQGLALAQKVVPEVVMPPQEDPFGENFEWAPGMGGTS